MSMEHENPQARPAGFPPPRELALICLPVLALVPFAGTAFRIDDPMYIWAARQIQSNPFDPYGFSVNWRGWVEPMTAIMKNPPGVSYYAAAVASVAGWSETALHLAFLLPALAATLGIHRLAARFCAHPAAATLAAAATPVFMVSSLTIMSDITMLACFVWAVHLWITGLDQDNHRRLALASLLIALAALTKYFGIALIPLLAAYAFARKRRAGLWMVHFILPALALAWYQWATAELYGRGLLLDAVAYASEFERVAQQEGKPRIYTIFSFLGGCVATLLFYAPALWSRRTLLLGAAVAAASFLAIGLTIQSYPWTMDQGRTYTLISAQLAFWMAVGVSLPALAALDLYERRDADALLLALWVLGTCAFAGYFNWATNARAILPLAAPAGILILRRIERSRPLSPRAALAPALLSLCLSLAVVWADSRFAETARLATRAIMDRYGDGTRTVWFRGHWGLQHYLTAAGAVPQDFRQPAPFGPRDILVMPTINTDRGVIEPPPWAHIREVIGVPSSRWLTTMGHGAGFYSDLFGPMPFAFGPIAREEFAIMAVRPELQPE